MSALLAIDPGNTQSGYAFIDAETLRPLDVGKVTNGDLLTILDKHEWDVALQWVAIEMVASYGMAVGREVFETCVWIGRFAQFIEDTHLLIPRLVYRREVKLHHCQDSRAKDSNITQALVDRFAHNVPNRGKGTKAAPGWFHGFAGDIWQAYALAVYAAETQEVPF